jgi:hypothetical protein
MFVAKTEQEVETTFSTALNRKPHSPKIYPAAVSEEHSVLKAMFK